MKINGFNEFVSRTNVMAFVHLDDLLEGKKYDVQKIQLVEQKEINVHVAKVRYYHFEVDSESKNTYYDVDIYIENSNKIIRTLCDCKQFGATKSCKHIAASFAHFYNELFKSESLKIDDLSMDILNSFLPSDKAIIKKELNVELHISSDEINDYYSGHRRKLNAKLMIGEKKLYVMGTHLNAFMNVYDSGSGEVYFGKEFTYNPETYYLSTESEVLLRAYDELSKNSYGTYRNFRDMDVKKFLRKIRNSEFIFDNYKMKGIIDNFPLGTNLIKKKNNYLLKFDKDSLYPIIDEDYEYVSYKGKLYHLQQNEQNLLAKLEENSLDKLVIAKGKVSIFTKGLLNVIKKNLNVDSSVDDIVFPKNIDVEIYFDLRNNFILANVKFKYDNIEIDYFNNDNLVVRDMEYETKVINDILKYGFIFENNKLLLKDLELQVEFMEQGLELLAKDYVVFTTEKFKKVDIKKKTNASSMFGIGKDNILSYSFNLGDIKSDELVNIFKEIKNKKKYYRLKNGDILNLEDESLNELCNLSDDLELSDEDIIAGKGALLKYRAIYLDSLKNTEYNIISTNNLFDELINKFNVYKDSELTLSKDELSVLRDYQVTGVKWLYNLDKTGFGGILADEMGLGKTIQIIYYIKQILMEDKDATFLIVVPTSLAYNWEHEFDKYGQGIKYTICVGEKHRRIDILNNLKKVNVLVTTYGTLREDEEIYEKLEFHTMIIDEAQNIKNTMAGITKCVKRIKANTKFALTGTPLENSILELWSIFDFIMPGYLASLTKFQSKYKIKDFDEDSEVLIKGLSKQINPFILRRKKSDVIKELPSKLENNIYIDLTTDQKKIYVAELERVKKEMEEIMASEGINKARFMILPLLTKLRQICIHPSILYENYSGGSNKIEQLLNIVLEYTKNGHKILIFSSFKSALDIVRDTLDKNKVNSYTISGSVSAKSRINMVDKFNEEDDTKVFLIMLKAGGTGLNLASADIVIHLDLWWNPQAENQATDRVHRIGQINTVEVIHLITKGTIEEKILELQNKKKLLSDKIIDGEARDKNILSKLTQEDIQKLLSYEND